jgi:NADH:ubiquinone oxidoreductase subunit F (NADH-binding)/(2Fe-2S) ferredoxin
MEKLTIQSIGNCRVAKKQQLNKRLFPGQLGQGEYELLVCSSTGCESNKADVLYQKLNKYIDDKGLGQKINVCKTGCFGFCEKGPIIKTLPHGAYYTNLTSEGVDRIIEDHLLNGKIVDDLLIEEQRNSKGYFKEISLIEKQQRIVLSNNGKINPENIDEYIAVDGYRALEIALNLSPDEIINEIKISRLRGRGGAGYPVWRKWTNGKNAKGDRKYVICNGDEGDPGAFMDRSILEGDPHAVIEAMAIAAFTIGANQGYFYIRAEYNLAIKRVQIAIDQAYEVGLLGENILGSGFSVDIEIRLGAGAFVCGEETALIASIEGERGMPRPRPPYPSVKGLFGQPTVINNVETLANIPRIITNGGAWFSSIGTENSSGTKVFALTGKVNISGLIEVPMGTTINEIIYGMGGGIANGKKAKAVQTGGPSGGIIPAEYFDTPIDYESLTSLGSMMGSGGMIVMDEDDSMVEIAKFYVQFNVDESCGKCAPCRIGNYQMLKILERFSRSRGKESDIPDLMDIAFAMQKGSLCGLGQTAPNPVISTLKYFRDEYTANIRIPKKDRIV